MQETPPSRMVLRYFLLLFVLVVLLLGRLLWPFLSILILSYLLTSLFKPVYNTIHRRFSADFSSLITCVFIILLVFIPLVFFVLSLSREVIHLYESGMAADLGGKIKDFQHSETMRRILDLLASYGLVFEPESISNAFSDMGKSGALYLYNQVSAWAANIMQWILSFCMMILTIFFLLIDQERLLNFMLRLSPLPDDQDKQLLKKFDETTTAVLIGNGITSLVQGVLCGVIFAVYDLGPPVVWGVISAILAFLPIVGIGLVLVPVAIILVVKGSLESGLLVLAFYVLITVVVEYVLKTKVVGEQAQMHSLLVLIAIMGGLGAFGMLGIIYGPLIVSAFLTMADIYLTSYDKYVKMDHE